MFDTGAWTPASPVRPEDLAGLDLDALSDDALVDVIVAAERVVSQAKAVQLAAIARLFDRRVADGGGQFAADEVAAALHTSRVAADRLVSLAVEVARLPGTAAALAAGEIDLPRARVLADAVVSLPEELARAVETAVLGRAPTQTPGQLAATARRAVLAVDPAAAQDRHERAVAGRSVTVYPRPDGMAELCALLPADRAVAVYHSLDRIARGLGSADPRSMDARRADSLVGLLLGTTTVDGNTTPHTVRALVQVTVPASTLLGADDTPGELAGYGPIPASLARRLAAESDTWRRLLTHPDTGALLDYGRSTYTPPAALRDFIRARDATCRFPGCRQPAYRCDLDHTIPHPEGETCPGNLGALCRHHHLLKHHGHWTAVQDEFGVYTWTSPTGRIYVTHPPPLDEPEPISKPPRPVRDDHDTAA